jgi:putative endopeptidase
MNVDAIENAGMTPVQPLLDAVKAVSSQSELAQLLAELNLVGIGALLKFAVMPDLKDSSNEVLWLFGADLGLGDRDYYVNANKSEQRTQYLKFVTALLSAAGDTDEVAKESAEVRSNNTLSC